MTYPTIRPELTLDFANSRQLDPRITFSRSSSATYLNPDTGLITLASDHEARFEKEGLLIEESRTNYLSNSVFSFFTENGTNIVKEQNTPDLAAPDGTFTATHITADGINFLNSQFPTPASTDVGKKFTYSYWVYVISCTPWAGTGTGTDNTVRLGIDTNTTPYYDNRTVEKNKWVRIQITTPNTYVAGKDVQCSMFREIQDVDVYVWGFQCENGEFATSLIPTAGATATRAADIARITGTNFSSWYNTSEGSFTYDVNVSNGSAGIAELRVGGDSASRGRFTRQSSKYFMKLNGGGAQVTGNTNIPDGFARLAYRMEPGEHQQAVNGVIDNSYAGGGFSDPIPLYDNIQLGISENYSVYINGHISRLAYYPRRLTDLELETVTL